MKAKLFVMVLIIAVFVSGCVSIEYPSTLDKDFPPDGRYEILGPVTHIGHMENILGIFWNGGTGYTDLYHRAKIRYNADDVVSISIDKNVLSILGIYTKTEYILRGTAIRYLAAPPAAFETELAE